MDIISRTAWGARAPRDPAKRYVTTWAKRVEFVTHHSEGPTTQTPRQIQNFHMDDRGWNDIGYNFLVDDRGTIYEGRGWLVVGAQAQDHNTSGIGVCYIGQNAPTAAAKASIRALYDEACKKAGRALLKRGHGQLSGNSTDCPGSNLLAWVKAGMPAPTTTPVPPATAPPWPGRVFSYASGKPVMYGDDIEAWQKRMEARGWVITTDGHYAQQSADVARAFQAEKGLARDGKVDMDDWDGAFKLPVT